MNDDSPHAPAVIDAHVILAAIVDSSRDAIVCKTAEGIIASWNRIAERIFGYTSEEAIGAPATVLTPANRASEAAAILARLRRGERIENFETVRLHKDGRPIAVSMTLCPLCDDEQRFVGTCKIVRTVSSDSLATDALRQSEARLASIVDSAMDAILTVDDQGKIVLFNDAAATMFGCARGDAHGQSLARFLPARYRADHPRWMARFGKSATSTRAMGSRRGEITALRADGTEFPVEASISHVEVDRRQLFTVILRDVSALRQAVAERQVLRAQLQEAQKMEAIGTLAGGIAHDFNNIIASILGNAGLARLDLAAGHPALQSLDQIELAATRARAVVRQILAFTRRQPQQLLNQPLAPIIQETVGLLRATLPSFVSLELQLPEAPLNIEADATQIHQVMMNLCTNAWHALRGGTGRVEVGLARVTLDTSGAIRLGDLGPGLHAYIWVRDDGCGMDEATQSRIFEPFFTTKPRGEGTGLGLSVVHGIVVAHRGAISVNSAPGGGTTFHLYFPEASPSPQATPRSVDTRASCSGLGHRVFYIDDDEVMLLMAERLLARSGFQVTCFRDARIALESLKERPHACDVVVSDYNMPNCSGIDLATELARAAPNLPVVISSGHISDGLREAAQRVGVRALFEKENTFEDLCGLVERIISEG